MTLPTSATLRSSLWCGVSYLLPNCSQPSAAHETVPCCTAPQCPAVWLLISNHAETGLLMQVRNLVHFLSVQCLIDVRVICPTAVCPPARSPVCR